MLCTYKDPDALPRKIEFWDSQQVVELGEPLRHVGDQRYAPVLRYIPIRLLRQRFLYPDDVPTDPAVIEGAKQSVTVNRYERDPRAREACLAHYAEGGGNVRCQICDLSFQERYGDIGKGFIHVHHLKPLSTLGEDYVIDPIRDLIPVCPNCHAMLHSSEPPLVPAELKSRLSL